MLHTWLTQLTTADHIHQCVSERVQGNRELVPDFFCLPAQISCSTCGHRRCFYTDDDLNRDCILQLCFHMRSAHKRSQVNFYISYNFIYKATSLAYIAQLAEYMWNVTSGFKETFHSFICTFSLTFIRIDNRRVRWTFYFNWLDRAGSQTFGRVKTYPLNSSVLFYFI